MCGNRTKKIIGLLCLYVISLYSIAAGMSTIGGEKKENSISEIIIVNGKPVEIPGPHPNCNIMEFQRHAFTIHNTDKRKQAILKWIENHGPDCRDYDLNNINNNTANWLGTADGIEIKSLIYKLYYHTKRPVNSITPAEDPIPQLPLSYKDKK